MIECSAGEKCSRGWWFHLECLGISKEDPLFQVNPTGGAVRAAVASRRSVSARSTVKTYHLM